MDFLVRKFSDWLNTTNVPHNLIKVKGGYIIKFIEPDENLRKAISSLFITIDTSEEVNHRAVRKPVNIFTSGGDGIVIEDKYYADILSACYPVIREYAETKLHKKLAMH